MLTSWLAEKRLELHTSSSFLGATPAKRADSSIPLKGPFFWRDLQCDESRPASRAASITGSGNDRVRTGRSLPYMVASLQPTPDLPERQRSSRTLLVVSPYQTNPVLRHQARLISIAFVSPQSRYIRGSRSDVVRFRVASGQRKRHLLCRRTC